MSHNVRRISRQLLAYGSADVAVLAINFLLLPVYTRVLSPAEYGALALLLIIETLLKLVLRFGLDSAYQRLYYDYPDDTERRSLAGTLLAFLVAVNATAMVLIWVNGPALADHFLGTSDYAGALRLVALHTVLSNFVFLPLSHFRVLERSSLVAWLTFARSLSTVLLRLWLVVGLRLGVFGLALADVAVTAGLLVGLAPTLRTIVGGPLSPAKLRALLRYGVPQVPGGLFSQAMSMSDRYVLGLQLSLREVGVYSIGSTMASVLKLYPVAFQTAWMPFAFSSLRRPDAPQVFARLGSYAFAGLSCAAVAVALLAAPITALALPPSFGEAPTVVPLLAVGIVIQSMASFLTTSLNAVKQTGTYPVAAAVGAAASLGACLALVPAHGAIGAAVGTLFGQCAFTVLTAWFAQRCYPIPYEKGRLLKVSLVALGCYTAGVALQSGSPWLDLMSSLLCAGAFPVLLLASGFLRPWEWATLRALVGRPTGGPATTKQGTPTRQ